MLSDILGTLRLESSVFAQTWLNPPWGIRAEPRPPGPDSAVAFHIISQGRALLEVDGLPPVELAAGDVIVLTPGRGHTLRDAPGTTPRDLQEMLAAGEFGPLSAPNGRSGTYLICGCFQFENLPANHLLQVLPTMIHTSSAAGTGGPWLAQTVALLADESGADRPGRGTVVRRLCDALFVYLLRSHLATLPPGETSWLRALDDPQIGAALGLMHRDPAAEWTVGALAAGVGMSRSAFAERFAHLVGQSPMRYLSQWRLHKAATELLAADSSVAAVAAGAGYDSTAAFSKAFKRTIGVAPGAYRRANGTR